MIEPDLLRIFMTDGGAMKSETERVVLALTVAEAADALDRAESDHRLAVQADYLNSSAIAAKAMVVAKAKHDLVVAVQAWRATG
jgi:hypothetical protein